MMEGEGEKCQHDKAKRILKFLKRNVWRRTTLWRSEHLKEGFSYGEEFMGADI